MIEANGISTSGGPVEIIIEPQQASITAHGKEGVRKIRFPGAWNVKDLKRLNVPLAFKAGEWVLDYRGESSLTVILERQ